MKTYDMIITPKNGTQRQCKTLLQEDVTRKEEITIQTLSHWKGSLKKQLPMKHPTSKSTGNVTNA